MNYNNNIFYFLIKDNNTVFCFFLIINYIYNILFIIDVNLFIILLNIIIFLVKQRI